MTLNTAASQSRRKAKEGTMTPNLKRMFQQSKRNSYVCAELGCLLLNHGEALIEALERLLAENEDYIKINNLSAMGNVNLVNARQLLAQLEAEAQP